MESKQSSLLNLRKVTSGEIEAALRMILGDPDDSHVREFEEFARGREMDLAGITIVEQQRRMVWAILPMVAPGKTMMLMGPPIAPSADRTPAAVTLINYVCEQYEKQGVNLAQSLIDPHSKAYRDLYREAEFWDLAELVYLQKNVSPAAKQPVLPEGLRVQVYSSETHELFKQTILATYRDSLDCPGLKDLRDMEDVIAGHKAAGDFEPADWIVLANKDQGFGALLLTKAPRGDAMELVYLGLIPEARHYGLGTLLMKHAIAMTARANLPRLVLAVDSRNEPAIKLYHKHGFSNIGSRLAMMRDLRK